MLQVLYGLKRSPRQYWYQKLNETFTALALGFRRLQSDASMYVRAKDKVRIIIPVYVDDLTNACNDRPALDWVKSELKARFKLLHSGHPGHPGSSQLPHLPVPG